MAEFEDVALQCNMETAVVSLSEPCCSDEDNDEIVTVAECKSTPDLNRPPSALAKKRVTLGSKFATTI